MHFALPELKKTVAILFIAVLVFNWYGYRLVIDVLAKHADERLEVQLDNNDYVEDQLIELKIPLNVPYQNDQAGFERCYGKIEINGTLYTYVKRKIENGCLIMKCIPNKTKQQVTAAGNDYFKETNGLAQPGKQSAGKNFSKNFWSEYENNDGNLDCLNFTCPHTIHFIYSSSSHINRCLSVPAQPPDLVPRSQLYL